jgi:hypothetical protein
VNSQLLCIPYGLTRLPHSVQMNTGINAEIVLYSWVEVSKVEKESIFFLICSKEEGDFYSDWVRTSVQISSEPPSHRPPPLLPHSKIL